MPAATERPTTRRRWPVVLLVVLVVLAALVVVAEFVLRGVVDRIIAQQVEQSLPDGTTGQVDAHAEGIVIPQLISGTLDRVEISSAKLTVDGIPLAADVTAQDVPVDGKGDVRDVDGTVTLASSSVKDLAKYSPLFDRLNLVDGGVELTGSSSVLGYDITYAAKGAVVAQDDGRGISITPESVRITNSDLGLKVDSIPGVTGVPVQVCTAQFLPEALRVRSLDVSRSDATVRITADALPLNEDGLRTVGSCG
ncbi:LmeA family phospholipid-binding protein [Curtobacterium flaccumfaciens]|uniref:LmeA family phospholipid-binding protein n=1 Tax=Curtobacterium flaccumfaciens TaxID=2035 RepID=UPI001ADC34FB|nr:LmeA family phospholipid-binding protein [Curtobacterium flaccumfaciens]MBO9051947.1 LmeA family phospholipid-binding protein [Curtobacterium flaccumfaciens pv. flaccumfaciens]